MRLEYMHKPKLFHAFSQSLNMEREKNGTLSARRQDGVGLIIDLSGGGGRKKSSAPLYRELKLRGGSWTVAIAFP